MLKLNTLTYTTYMWYNSFNKVKGVINLKKTYELLSVAYTVMAGVMAGMSVYIYATGGDRATVIGLSTSAVVVLLIEKRLRTLAKQEDEQQ